MSEQLLLRKGLYANLSSAPITPGAISITTDEPGIYIDLANDRVRIGDFITFPSLQELKDKNGNYPIGETAVYSEHALYYAVKENVLCKYIPEDKDNNVAAHFVWINDTSELLESINTLN